MSIVFISYSHDSDAHKEKVLSLSERLRLDGFETRLDQYVNGAPPEKWHRWMLNRLDEAQFVLVICTETYYRRFRGQEEPGKGKGVDFEGALITQEIYDARSKTLKFVPILFSPEDDKYIPEPLRGLTHYTLTSEASYEALHDFMRDQAAVEPGPVGEPRRKERRRGTPLTFDEASKPSAAVSDRISPSRLRHGAAKLFGREKELADLDAAWANPTTNVLSIVAWGGEGKTSLVATWAAQLAARGYDGARYFDWSFYSQGTRDQTTASSDAFIAKALESFGDPWTAESPASPWDKGARLAQLLAQERTLLVLDGLEPLQYPPGPLAGELRDPALSALLKGLAQHNPGLCVVTTREQVVDLASFRDTTAPEWKLEHLSETAGIELLKLLGVRGTQEEIKQLVRDVRGHALTLNLLGRFLARAHGGDIRRRDRVDLTKADATVQGSHAFRAMAAYETWLGEGDEAGARQLAILRLLGLFDRPADVGCLAALRRAPAITGLTGPLVDLGEDDWNLTVASLVDCGLTSWGETDASLAGAEPVALDAHPLIREYFANRLRSQNPDAWRAAHSRLFDHLKDSAETTPDTLAGLQPLYQAVAHGCQANRHQEARADVYRDRILRGNQFYSTKKLGNFGTDLAALSCFFEKPWSQVFASLSDHQAWLLNEAGFRLRALGRLSEALEPIRAALKIRIEQEAWESAAIVAGNLSGLEVMLGAVELAVKDAELSVVYAERGGETFGRMTRRTTLGDALLQAGRRDEAEQMLKDAESMLEEIDSEFPLLYSIQGFRYCELLLARAERAAWRVMLNSRSSSLQFTSTAVDASYVSACRGISKRAQQTLRWAVERGFLLDIALNHLSLSRAILYRVLLQSGSVVIHKNGKWRGHDLRQHTGAAVDCLRHASTTHYIPQGLLTRAWLEQLESNTDNAKADLNEAWEIAERGPMRLYMADIHLYRARLFHAVEPYPWTSPRDDLAAARKLIEQCGYWRRKEELEDAETAAESW